MEMMIVLGNCWALGETLALLSASFKVSGECVYSPPFDCFSLYTTHLFTMLLKINQDPYMCGASPKPEKIVRHDYARFKDSEEPASRMC